MNKVVKVWEKIKPLAIVVLAVFITFAVNMNWDKDTAIRYSFTGNSVIIVAIFILIYGLLKDIANIKNKKMKIICMLLAILFASFEVVGNSIDNYLNLGGIFGSQITITKAIIKWFGYLMLIYAILSKIFYKLDINEIKLNKYFTHNKRSFFITWGIIFLAWIPYFLNYFPGVITADSMAQICQSLGINSITNHHPVFHTFLIGIAMNVGKLIGNYNIGIGVYSFAQMLIVSSIFSFTIYYMAKRNVDIRIRILSLIFYAFYPVNALYSITMWKDIPFAVCMLIFVIFMTEIAINKEHFMKSKLKLGLLAISMILVFLFRNNGFYVVILMIPFLFVFTRKYYKKIIVVTAIVLVAYIGWTKLFFGLLNIKQGSSREALSIPLQQFARITKNHSDTLTENEKWQIYKYLPTDQLATVYTPKISDPVKNNFDDKAFKEDKIGLVKLYIKLAFKYPRATVESFLCGNFGYWYPEAIHWVVGREVFESKQEKEAALEIKNNPIIELKGVEEYNELLDRRDLPLNSMIYSIGFAFWIVLTMFGYTIYKKRYNLIIIYLPILFLWLTTIASPVFGEFRYIYSMFVCMPMLVGIQTRENKNM